MVCVAASADKATTPKEAVLAACGSQMDTQKSQGTWRPCWHPAANCLLGLYGMNRFRSTHQFRDRAPRHVGFVLLGSVTPIVDHADRTASVPTSSEAFIKDFVVQNLERARTSSQSLSDAAYLCEAIRSARQAVILCTSVLKRFAHLPRTIPPVLIASSQKGSVIFHMQSVRTSQRHASACNAPPFLNRCTKNRFDPMFLLTSGFTSLAWVLFSLV